MNAGVTYAVAAGDDADDRHSVEETLLNVDAF